MLKRNQATTTIAPPVFGEGEVKTTQQRLDVLRVDLRKLSERQSRLRAEIADRTAAFERLAAGVVEGDTAATTRARTLKAEMIDLATEADSVGYAAQQKQEEVGELEAVRQAEIQDEHRRETAKAVLEIEKSVTAALDRLFESLEIACAASEQVRGLYFERLLANVELRTSDTFDESRARINATHRQLMAKLAERFVGIQNLPNPLLYVQQGGLG